MKDDSQHKDSDSIEERSKEALNLATYLWENYIELNDNPHIFILGVGAAYNSVIELLKANDRVSPRISKVFFFVSDQSLNSCRSATDDYLPIWYYDTSLVFVAHDHHIWDYTNGGGAANGGAPARKPKKRFGCLVRSEHDGLEDMLAEQRARVCDVMEQAVAGWEEAVGSAPAGVASNADGDAAMADAPAGSPVRAGGAPDVAGSRLTSPTRLPPVGNFALSPKRLK